MTGALAPFAVDYAPTGSLEQLLIRVLAVLGGAAFGAFASGGLTRLLVRSVSTRKAPPWSLRVIRLLGAGVFGLVTALILFGTGGWGGGGGSGWNFFGGGGGAEGTGKGSGTPPTAKTPPPEKKEKEAPDPKKPDVLPAAQVLRVEVLGDARVEGERFYRLEGAARLHTLAEVRDVLRARRKAEPPLKGIVLVIYKNSPDEQKYQVLALQAAAEEQGLTVAKELPPRDAP